VDNNSFILETTLEIDARKMIAEYAKKENLLILTLRKEEKTLEEVFKSLTT
jgi:ABC-2 type transport system ATP-binding protein